MREEHGNAQTAPAVPARATQGAETRDWSRIKGPGRVEAKVWTERMVLALGNGVKGGKWYSLHDKVCAPATPTAAWSRVEANGGAAGVPRPAPPRI